MDFVSPYSMYCNLHFLLCFIYVVVERSNVCSTEPILVLERPDDGRYGEAAQIVQHSLPL
jgi:hypothetical protein